MYKIEKLIFIITSLYVKNLFQKRQKDKEDKEEKRI